MIAPRLILAAALTFTAAPASALCLCLKCLTGEFQSFQPVSGSMKPALEPDACAIVYTKASPLRGQIIAFRNQISPQLIGMFRLIGQPGDTVQIQNGQIILNGTPLPQIPVAPYLQRMQPEGAIASTPLCPTPTAAGDTCTISRFTEILPDGTAYDILDIMPDGPGDTMAELTIPLGHVFVLGDNRDNAADSRYGLQNRGMGLIPMEFILGTVVEITNPAPP